MHLFSLPRGAETCEVTPPGIAPLRITGLPAGDPHIYGRLRQGDLFEPHILAALRKLIAPGGTVLDVGANIGWFTLCMRHLAGRTGTVVAIEPDPTNLRLLRHNLRRNRAAAAVRVVAAAAGAQPGATLLRRSTSNAGDHRVGGQAGDANTIAVRVVALDSLAHLCGSLPLVVKIDTQGAETGILEGAATLLRRHPARAIIEFWPFGLVDCGSSPDALVAEITRHFDRLWVLFQHQKPQPVTPDELLHMAATNLSPKTEMFADIVALRTGDAEAVASMTQAALWEGLRKEAVLF
jgi:FkbM family methyltransferase